MKVKTDDTLEAKLTEMHGVSQVIKEEKKRKASS